MNAAVLQAIMKPIWNPMQWKQPQSYSFASNQQKRMVKLSNCKWFSVLHPLTSNLWFPFSSHFTHIYLSHHSLTITPKFKTWPHYTKALLTSGTILRKLYWLLLQHDCINIIIINLQKWCWWSGCRNQSGYLIQKFTPK